MARLTFQGDSLKVLGAFCTQHGVHPKLVKDEGIYLIAFAGQEKAICYASGYDPKVVTDPGELFDKSRAAVGGDDFVEDMKLDATWYEKMQLAGAAVVVKLTASKLDIGLTLPDPDARQPKSKRAPVAKGGRAAKAAG